MDLGKVDYSSSVAPDKYCCSACSRKNCKLWRQYMSFSNHVDLLCGECALKDQEESGPINEIGKRPSRYGYGGETDQIGWLVPAVPTEEGDTYWGYTAVPEPGCIWWRNLPT